MIVAQGETKLTASVIVVSTSASKDATLDTTGPMIRDWLEREGFAVPGGVQIVADGSPFERLLTETLYPSAGASPDFIITTGGTGLAPDDRTPEATAPFIDRVVPGIVEEIRRRGVAANVPAALLTRGIAGFADRTFIVNLPGSPGAVADGLAVLETLHEHLFAQHAGKPGHHRSHER